MLNNVTLMEDCLVFLILLYMLRKFGRKDQQNPVKLITLGNSDKMNL